MSVRVLDLQDAIAYIDKCKHAKESVTKNFQDVFGTAGCLLNCNYERTFEDDLRGEKAEYASKTSQRRKDLSHNRKLQCSKFRESRQTWFAGSKFVASAAQGCQSCSCLMKIFLGIFFQGAQDLPDSFEYSVSQNFEIRYRLPGNVDAVAIARLFQPQGKQYTRSDATRLIVGRFERPF
ncbi:hypothetical protein GQ44DRAFT_284168 [Phaeosphaeriaceae sp. PMI808]|nr:hypothetical protein GQ44DRAFT_284168 [Phaeosphaeriaceae sp. PMI808]